MPWPAAARSCSLVSQVRPLPTWELWCRELLGKYATSSSGGGTHLRASTAPRSAGGSTPLPDRGGQSMSPAPAYLSPAFQLAAMEQEVQMAHAEAAAASQGGAGNTPDGAAAPGWQADDASEPPGGCCRSALCRPASFGCVIPCKKAAYLVGYEVRDVHVHVCAPQPALPARLSLPPSAVYSALTATARKLAGKPSFMEAYRQKFPAIMASTERLLQTVEKQRRPAAAAAVAEEEAAAGPVAALALAAAAAAGHEMAAPSLAASARHQVQHSLAADRWHGADVEESTLDLMAQVIHSRPAAEELREDMPHAACVLDSTEPATALAPSELALPPAEPQLHRAFDRTAANGGSGKQTTINSLHAEQASQAAPPAAFLGLQSAPRSERSKPQLEQAIAAALGRSTAAVPIAASVPEPAELKFAAAPSATATLPSSRPAAAAADAPAAVLAAPMPTPQAPPGSAIRSAACPPPPPTAPSMPAAATAPAAQAAVPPLRPVGPDEYSALPTFIRSGLPLDTLNAALAAVNSMVQERSTNGEGCWAVLHRTLRQLMPVSICAPVCLMQPDLSSVPTCPAGFTMEDVEASGLAGAKHKVRLRQLGSRAHLCPMTCVCHLICHACPRSRHMALPRPPCAGGGQQPGQAGAGAAACCARRPGRHALPACLTWT